MKKLFCLSALFAIAISAHAQKHTVVGRIAEIGVGEKPEFYDTISSKIK